MSSTIKVDNLVNQSGDNDSGLDLSTNDQVIIKTANTTALTVDSSQNVTFASKLATTNLGTGAVVQVKNFQTGDLDTGTTTIPFDDTIPQITEGDEYMTLAFTPTVASNKLKIDVVVNIANDATVHLITALFVGTTANALACAFQYALANNEQNIKFTHYMEAGATTELTFRVRAGGSASGNTTFNGQNEVAKFGGVSSSSITITEIGG
jgi:hypothetical protein